MLLDGTPVREKLASGWRIDYLIGDDLDRRFHHVRRRARRRCRPVQRQVGDLTRDRAE